MNFHYPNIAYGAVIATLTFVFFLGSTQEEKSQAFRGFSDDLYVFSEREDKVMVTWVRDTKVIQKEIDKYVKAHPGRGTPVGLARPDGKKCTVYAPEVMYDGDYNSVILAHEISHCFGMVHE